MDGMSGDGTREILAQWRLCPPNLHLIDKPTGIAPAAMNMGFKAAKGEWVLIINLNRRLLHKGGTIWLNREIEISHFTQGSLQGLLRQALGTEKWNAWMWYTAPYTYALQRLIPTLFVFILIALVFLYPFSICRPLPLEQARRGGRTAFFDRPHEAGKGLEVG